MRRGLQTLTLVLLCALLAAACDGGDEQASRPQTTRPSGIQLPAAVADKRKAIVDAAHAHDYDRLETLLDPATFSYSFGESGDPVGYWRRLEQEGHVPILGDYLPVILGGPFARRGDIYVWPSVYGKKPARWTPGERRWLRNFYSEEEIRSFEQIGDYLGWRVGIRKDGTWLFFVAGD
jgi:hypothetical protein